MDKIKKSSEYEKRQTKSGNDQFDYLDATPDPDDDCNMPLGDPSAMHSFKKKNPSDAKAKYEKMNSDHKTFVKKLGRNKRAFENMLKNRSAENFRVRFSGL